MSKNQYDIILSGGGCAGRSLAVHLASQSALRDKKILLLDTDPKKSNDRTWCFWDTQAPEFFADCTLHWDNMEVCHPQGSYASSLNPYRYYHLSGLDFYQKTDKILGNCPNFTFRQEKVTNVIPGPGLVSVQTDHNCYTGSQLFNSIPFLLDPPPPTGSACLQHFYGWFVHSKRPVFQADTVRLMDFRVAQNGNARFVYVLPFSEHRALVEFTVFSDTTIPIEEYQAALKDYLYNNYQLKEGEFGLEEEEKGQIPMTMHPFPFEVAPNMYNIGTAGGMTKATTGYTFKTIQKASREIAQALAHGKQAQATWEKARRFGFYDRLLIHIIQKEGGQVEQIMRRLFQKNKMPTILKFLDEASHLLEEIPILLSLPWMPFLKSLYACYGQTPLFPQAAGRSPILDRPNPSYNV